MSQAFSSPFVARNEVDRVAVKLFLGISKEWELTDDQQRILIGLPSTPITIHEWKQKLNAHEPITLSEDSLERISHIAGIYKLVQTLFSDPTQWKTWVHKANQYFEGHSALEHMLLGGISELKDVRRYLQEQ